MNLPRILSCLIESVMIISCEIVEKINTKHSLSMPQGGEILSPRATYIINYDTKPDNTAYESRGPCRRYLRARFRFMWFLPTTFSMLLEQTVQASFTRSGVFHALKYGAWTDSLINELDIDVLHNPLKLQIHPDGLVAKK